MDTSLRSSAVMVIVRRWAPRALAVLLLAAAVSLLGWRAVLLMTADRPAAVGLGVAVLVVVAVGVAAVAAELRFGVHSASLAHRLDAAHGLPEDLLARSPSGRVVRSAADADFARWRADVQTSPGDWRAWYRLALAYDASGDRRRARAATRRAIGLARSPGMPDGDWLPGTPTGEAGRRRSR